MSIEDVTADVASKMDAILAHFKQPAKITVLVRRTEHPDGSQDLLLTDDDLPAVVEAIGRHVASRAGSCKSA